MRNIAIATVLLVLGTATVISLSGCREESGNMSLRKARLVGNENIELKKQLKLRDEEIERQKQLVEQCYADRIKDKDQTGENTINLLKHLSEASMQVTALKAENAQLKEKIKELQAK